jgi:hypothetical protein
VFTLTPQHLRQLLDLNDWPAPAAGMVFLGLRGARPANPEDRSWSGQHQLEAIEADHLHPRCTLVQWRPEAGELAVYPGSTVPHVSYMREALAAGGRGANELLTGYYEDFRRGTHKSGTANAHAAFIQTAPRPFRRTADDLDYDADDPAEVGTPHDNLHAAWAEVDSIRFASAGCQVVVGYPASPARGARGETGPWAVFRQRAYAEIQASYPYALLTGLEAQRLASAGPAGMRRLRFGSRGPRVEQLQRALVERGFLPLGERIFGERTLVALLAAQSRLLGPHADDGILGPVTARALGIPQLID